MSKTIDLQVEKSRSLIEGYRNNLAELQAKGVTAAQLDKMEEDLKKLRAAGEECDRLRAELSEKVNQTNALLQTVKDDFLEQKKVVKSSYDQEAWQRYGIMDKR
ncbi:MAG: hypothetical protein IJV05_10160 [Muribaculaceae bacterium]|nr:hypothetical protein [Muribaculaceae bacterium]